jgi:hypothetical protein
VDDVARGLVVLTRADEAGGGGQAAPRTFADPAPSSVGLTLDPADLAHAVRVYLRFVTSCQDADGGVVNRCDVLGSRHGPHEVGDCWGRALWGLGTAVGRSRDPAVAETALQGFAVSAARRSPWPRAMAFAGLGAVEVLRIDSQHAQARALLEDAVATLAGPGPDPLWPWPEPRLTYANAVLPDLLLAAGDCLGDDSLVTRGLCLLDWLLEAETADEGHLSVTPVGGRGPGHPKPAFDQQPIEAAALADACARAYELTDDPRWSRGVEAAAAWFFGANDSGAVLYDPVSGGCRDGLQTAGANQNQGAESTLALISTLQHAGRLATARV